MPSKSKTVLIVHPDKQITDHFRRCVADADNLAIVQCRSRMPEASLETLGLHLVIAWEESPVSGGATYFESLTPNPPSMPVILISENGSINRAVQSVRMGVQDYVLKDAAIDLVRASVLHALNPPVNPVAPKGGQVRANGSRPIITQAKVMKSLLATADRIASAPATVLIRGESGTGKELLARYIHQQSHRAQRPFVAMNCAALPEHLAESELFGYEKGAFTGASARKTGKFEQAHMGTLLLDEISEMPMVLQVKLLRVLQEKEVDHIGGKAPIPVDTRVIATTNRNLAKMVQEGKFREDLFYRLRVVPLIIPPLRERREDIPLLAEYFIARHSPGHLESPPNMSTETMQALSSWPWPGNVRELENTIERAVLISDGGVIEPDSLLLEDELAVAAPTHHQSLVGTTVREMERKLIGETLDHVDQNRTHAAKMLGISIRTLRNKLKEYKTLPSESTGIGADGGAQQ